MNDAMMEEYWKTIPNSRTTAASYDELCAAWGASKRTVRNILHELARCDNGDDLVLIRSASGIGFYKTSDRAAIAAYRGELIGRGKKLFSQLRKIDRVLNTDPSQLTFTNNLRTVRILRGMKQEEVCERMKAFDPTFNVSTLSRMENDRCLPTPYQLAHLACILRCTASDLVDGYFYAGDGKTRENDLQAANSPR